MYSLVICYHAKADGCIWTLCKVYTNSKLLTCFRCKWFIQTKSDDKWSNRVNRWWSKISFCSQRWREVRRSEERWGEVKRGEGGEEMWWNVRRGEVMWGEVKRGEERWGEVRGGEERRGEVRWRVVKRGEERWSEVRRGEEMWGEMRRGEESIYAGKLRWDLVCLVVHWHIICKDENKTLEHNKISQKY